VFADSTCATYLSVGFCASNSAVREVYCICTCAGIEAGASPPPSPPPACEDASDACAIHSSEGKCATHVTVHDVSCICTCEDVALVGLVPNHDMESDSDWGHVAYYTWSDVESQSSSQAHSGTYSRVVWGYSEYDGTQSSTFHLDAGYVTTVEAWVYISSGTVVLKATDGSGNWLSGGAYGSASSAWQKLYLTFTPWTSGSNARVAVYQSGWQSATFYVDDVYVTQTW
jgi:hypothetical protein